ncbi:hypothetical protein F2Q68_00029049 [Brassica cretica]|uniref:Uncharacterized protein n=1 Tax=Brassica cretica TaxID=69181 RepID=A0A8S9GGW5_BRACR|nr:hypothetical protein F2Q68_00029049 [Brassica cretica]
MRNPVLPVSDPPSSLTGERMIQLCFNKAALSLSSYDFPCVNVITLFQPIFSVGVLVFGAFFAGARDLSFAFYGYAVVFLANITTAVYLATIARTGSIHGWTRLDALWWTPIRPGIILPSTFAKPQYCISGSLFTQMNVIRQLLGFFGSGLYAYYKIIGRQ